MVGNRPDPPVWDLHVLCVPAWVSSRSCCLSRRGEHGVIITTCKRASFSEEFYFWVKWRFSVKSAGRNLVTLHETAARHHLSLFLTRSGRLKRGGNHLDHPASAQSAPPVSPAQAEERGGVSAAREGELNTTERWCRTLQSSQCTNPALLFACNACKSLLMSWFYTLRNGIVFADLGCNIPAFQSNWSCRFVLHWAPGLTVPEALQKVIEEKEIK